MRGQPKRDAPFLNHRRPCLVSLMYSSLISASCLFFRHIGTLIKIRSYFSVKRNRLLRLTDTGATGLPPRSGDSSTVFPGRTHTLSGEKRSIVFGQSFAKARLLASPSSPIFSYLLPRKRSAECQHAVRSEYYNSRLMVYAFCFCVG